MLPTYAKAGVTPGYQDLVVVDGIGRVVADVVEVDVAAGWLIRQRRDETGRHIIDRGKIATQRLEGAFTLRTRTAA